MTKKSPLLKAVIIFLILPVLAVTGCATMQVDRVTGKKTANNYSLGNDIYFGNEAMAQTLNFYQNRNIPVNSVTDPLDKKEFEHARSVAQKIVNVTHIPELPYQFYYAKSSDPNAFSLPGGKIIVNEGLWNSMNGMIQKDNDAELAWVVGHEMGHITARHATEKITRQESMQDFLAGFGALVGVAVNAYTGSSQKAYLTSMAVTSLIGTVHNFSYPSYSKQQEFEADRLGMEYMAKAGYDPSLSIRIFERLKARDGDISSSTHPVYSKRAAQMMEYLPTAMTYYAGPR